MPEEQKGANEVLGGGVEFGVAKNCIQLGVELRGGFTIGAGLGAERGEVGCFQ